MAGCGGAREVRTLFTKVIREDMLSQCSYHTEHVQLLVAKEHH